MTHSTGGQATRGIEEIEGDIKTISRGRRAAFVLIKAFHTAVFALVSVSIVHVFLAGVLNRPSRWTGPALATALAECLVFVANRGRCPLTGLAEDLGGGSGRVTDIFLPLWFADRIPQIYTPPLAIGIVALLRRGWRPRLRAAR